MARKRADVLLVERGLAESRERARRLIMAGRARVGTTTLVKPSAMLEVDAVIELVEPERYVSRGGHKLEAALDRFAIDPLGLRCLDLGASTGGFTDCLLQAGAARVCTLDVGYGQLHPRLREDPRVTVLERVNVRNLNCGDLPFPPSFVTCDVSFIGLQKALPPVLACARPGWKALVLVKPQFEAGPADVGKGGVVRDPVVHERVLEQVAAQTSSWAAEVVGVAESALRGTKGNREFFLYLRAAPESPA